MLNLIFLIISPIIFLYLLYLDKRTDEEIEKLVNEISDIVDSLK